MRRRRPFRQVDGGFVAAGLAPAGQARRPLAGRKFEYTALRPNGVERLSSRVGPTRSLGRPRPAHSLLRRAAQPAPFEAQDVARQVARLCRLALLPFSEMRRKSRRRLGC